MYEIIDTPFSSVKTVRLEDGEDFRPCATGVDVDELKVRTLMEDLEGRAGIGGGLAIASAAHIDKQESVKNSREEAIERVSLAAWWALDRPFVDQVSNEQIALILRKNKIVIPGDYSVCVGYVESIDPGYHVACAIMTNSQQYPFAVLGGGCSASGERAAEKAIFESFQSWTASDWIRKNRKPEERVYWDTGELYRRSRQLLEFTNADMGTDHHSFSSAKSVFDNLKVRSTFFDGTYITEVIAPNAMHSSSVLLARLAMRHDERITVFTQHNF